MFQSLETPKDATYPEWDAILANGNVLVKCNSHRSREKLKYLLGFSPKGYYSSYSRHHVYEIPADKLESALEITGVTKSRKIYQIHPTWSN